MQTECKRVDILLSLGDIDQVRVIYCSPSYFYFTAYVNANVNVYRARFLTACELQMYRQYVDVIYRCFLYLLFRLSFFLACFFLFADLLPFYTDSIYVHMNLQLSLHSSEPFYIFIYIYFFPSFFPPLHSLT